MSQPSPEQNENKPGSEHTPDADNQPDCPQRAFAEAEAQLGSPVSIIPIAPMHWRMLAFLLDVILITLFATLLLTKLLWPQYHPVGYSQYSEQVDELVTSVSEAVEKKAPLPSPMEYIKPTDEFIAMQFYGVEILALCFIAYFVLCERFMAGGSLGKSMLRLRVISLNTGRPPNIWESFLRSLIKFCPLMAWPLCISYLLPFGNRLRRAGHDWLARTLVVSDTGGYVPHVAPPRKHRDEDDDDY